VSFVRRHIERVRYLWGVALAENSDPRKFAWSVAVGTVVSALPVPPALGLRSFAAVGAAWVARCSKLTAWLACHVFVLPIWIPLSMWEVRIGSALLGRPPPEWGATATERLHAAQQALLAWWIGGVLVAPVCGVLAFFIAWPIARKYQARRARRTSSRPPPKDAAQDGP
jgi:uncharacterized protein (DUF2062 family)